MHPKSLILRTLRITGATALVLALIVIVAIQIRQIVFRKQVERLHAEILALQLHSGTFDDVLRLQREWGAHGDYTGPCTMHHCIYNIEFEDGWFIRPRTQELYRSFIPRRWFFRIYPFLGGRVARVEADVRVRDNKVWGSDFSLGIVIYPGQGRNEGGFYQNTAIFASSTRVSHRDELSVRDIQQGFRTNEVLNCLGCEYVAVHMTPQTNAADVERFNRIRFNCLTGWRSCKHPIDLAPALWEQALKDEQSPQEFEGESWQLPPQILARETNRIFLVRVLSIESGQNVPGVEAHQDLSVMVLEPMKNTRAYRTGDILKFSASPYALWTGDGKGKSPLVVGGKYFFFCEYYSFYSRRDTDQIWSPTRGLWLAHALPNTPVTSAAMRQGIALDTSAGEPYDYLNEPYTEQ